jgi:hypothetical protein
VLRTGLVNSPLGSDRGGVSRLTHEDFGLSFVDNGTSVVRWRFLLAFQCFPALLLLAGIKFLPDSPRYLASVGRFEDAKEVCEISFVSKIMLTVLQVLEHIRGSTGPEVEKEFLEVIIYHHSFCFGRYIDLDNLDLCRC